MFNPFGEIFTSFRCKANGIIGWFINYQNVFTTSAFFNCICCLVFFITTCSLVQIIHFNIVIYKDSIDKSLKILSNFKFFHMFYFISLQRTLDGIFTTLSANHIVFSNPSFSQFSNIGRRFINSQIGRVITPLSLV